MATTTVTVPAEYAEAFRDAVLVEIRGDAERIASAIDEEQRAMFTARHEEQMARFMEKEPPKLREIVDGDIVGSVGSLGESYALLEPALSSAEEITGEIGTLNHVLETMADKVLTPKLAEAVNTSPIDAKGAAAITCLTDAIAWAAGESARLEALWQAEHAKAKAAS